MLELGKKSQQIGAVLDIVTELAEQTNILAINATIEAAGAGESGKRFAVVADEIRKLADRVGGSAKEIRSLIDDVRGSVNTTVMATETGSKAVDAGSRQFGDVATVFKEIAQMVATTTEAAREIELSTKQQATAVEQVNMAIASVAQATKETEASAGQTIADRVRARLDLARPAAAGPDAAGCLNAMARDPYRYFRIEARELTDQLGQGLLELETQRQRRCHRAAPAAARAYAQGRGPGRPPARDRRPCPRDRGAARPRSVSVAGLVPRENVDALLGLVDGSTQPVARPRRARR